VTVGMTEAQDRRTIPVAGMDCSSCIVNIEKELKRLKGVKELQGSYIMEKVVVTYDPNEIDVPAPDGSVTMTLSPFEIFRLMFLRAGLALPA